jgi:AcrR family transcriptional regulator
MAPEDRRAEILRVGREVFSQHSYAAVSMADIARAAGVTAPLIVFYFGSKRSLYLKIIQTAVDEIAEGITALPGPPSLDRLHASVRFYAEHARTHRAGFLSLLLGGTESALPEASALVESLRVEISTWIMTDLSAEGTTTAVEGTMDDRDRIGTLIAVRGYLGYVDSAIAHWLSLPEEQQSQLDAEAIACLAVGAFTGGLAAISDDHTTGLVQLDQTVTPATHPAP